MTRAPDRPRRRRATTDQERPRRRSAPPEPEPEDLDEDDGLADEEFDEELADDEFDEDEELDDDEELDEEEPPEDEPADDEVEPEPRRPVPARTIARWAADQLAEMSGKQSESVTFLRRGDEGWVVGLEVVESHRIPDSMDLLAIYEVEMDVEGELLSYRRVKRYSRGRGDDD